ncbi:hypothetical protein OO015_11775 [Thermomicrobium sp. 4228-Ro]|uniref:hypothetical protein n=1 Tax=Thermomicrobium sp. 4228-Ro TaxID=2993937 RepID=UPI0022489E62|nr:hypothetical protein [Thermomicrobium sp. 4228-Ro]MCX2728169.1 hypothetical protein [Thermomicrobium sp. 4228-Ro]
MEDAPLGRRVEPRELRRLFRESGLQERYERGELTELVKRSRHVADPTHLFSCSHAEVVRLFDGDRKVAVIHRYRRSDGSLAASGLPDPKFLRIDDVVYNATE